MEIIGPNGGGEMMAVMTVVVVGSDVNGIEKTKKLKILYIAGST